MPTTFAPETTRPASVSRSTVSITSLSSVIPRFRSIGGFTMACPTKSTFSWARRYQVAALPSKGW